MATTLGSGQFRYEVKEDWARLPDGWSFRDVAAVAVDHKDQDAALTLYKRILPLVKMVGGHRYVAASKVALDYMGLPVGAPRPPRLPLPATDAAALKAFLDRLALKNSIPLS